MNQITRAYEGKFHPDDLKTLRLAARDCSIAVTRALAYIVRGQEDLAESVRDGLESVGPVEGREEEHLRMHIPIAAGLLITEAGEFWDIKIRSVLWYVLRGLRTRQMMVNAIHEGMNATDIVGEEE